MKMLFLYYPGSTFISSFMALRGHLPLGRMPRYMPNLQSIQEIGALPSTKEMLTITTIYGH